MKITRIDTLRLDEFPSLVLRPRAHRRGAVGPGRDILLRRRGRGPRPRPSPATCSARTRRIEAHARTLRGYVGTAASGARDRAPPLRSTSRSGISAARRPASRCTASSAARARLDPHLQHVRRLPLRPRRARARLCRTGACRPDAEGPYEDLDAFLNRADELARRPARRGHHRDEDLAVRPVRRGEPRARHQSAAELERALEPFRKIREAVGAAIDVMVELHALWDVPAACRIVSALDEFALAWIEDPVRVSSPGALAEVAARHELTAGGRETLTASRVPRPDRRRRRADRRLRRRLGRRHHRGAQGRRAGRGLRRPVAPHDCTGPVVYTAATHLSMHLPNAMIQESVRAFWTVVRGARDGPARDRERDGVRAGRPRAWDSRSARRSSSARMHTSVRLS